MYFENIRIVIFPLLGGLGLFLFGMNNMSNGIKNIAGDRLKKILHYLTINRFMGIIAGTGITCLIQSSSAVTVMVVGFVNAGIMSLKQAISVIMGANIGTTITAWIVASVSWFKAMKISEYALPLIGIGFAMNFLSKSNKTRSYGTFFLGIGMLFLGLNFMKDSFSTFGDTAAHVFAKFGRHPFLGVMVGMVFTILLQSSSATIAVLQLLALNGVIGIESAIPIVLGDNIGTTITAQIAATGGNTAARRSAMAHSLFNIIGVAYMLIFVYTYIYGRVINALFNNNINPSNITWAIAACHTIFNVTNTVVFLPFVKWLEKITIYFVPKKAFEIDLKPRYLDRNLLNTPPVALEQTTREIIRMTGIAREAFNDAINGFVNSDRKSLIKVSAKEEAIDNLQTEITKYLVSLSTRSLDEEASQKLPVLLHTVNDIERVGDHSENIMEIAERKIEQKLEITETALEELHKISSEADSMIENIISALKNNDHSIARRALKREENINRMHMEFRRNHIERLNKGECGLLPGLVYIDMLANIEKIGDHITNVAQAVLGNLRWNHENESEEPLITPEIDEAVISQKK